MEHLTVVGIKCSPTLTDKDIIFVNYQLAVNIISN